MRGTVKPVDSDASEILLQLVQALVAYADSKAEFIELAQKIWPEGYVYVGGTHLRVCTIGHPKAASVYVEVL